MHMASSTFTFYFVSKFDLQEQHINKHSCKRARLAITANSQQLQVIAKLYSLGRFYKHYIYSFSSCFYSEHLTY